MGKSIQRVGICPVCESTRGLTRDGVIRGHQDRRGVRVGEGWHDAPCPGSGQQPAPCGRDLTGLDLTDPAVLRELFC